MDLVETRWFGGRSCRHQGVKSTRHTSRQKVTWLFHSWEQGKAACMLKNATHENRLWIRHNRHFVYGFNVSNSTLHPGMVNISTGADQPVVWCVGFGLGKFSPKNRQCHHHENQFWICPSGILHLVAYCDGLSSDNTLQTAHKPELHHQF